MTDTNSWTNLITALTPVLLGVLSLLTLLVSRKLDQNTKTTEATARAMAVSDQIKNHKLDTISDGVAKVEATNCTLTQLQKTAEVQQKEIQGLRELISTMVEAKKDAKVVADQTQTDKGKKPIP